tara:strand:+ start:1836 stop:2024 length:189 start_codon:yes stop_codon:yes gene_type:complete
MTEEAIIKCKCGNTESVVKTRKPWNVVIFQWMGYLKHGGSLFRCIDCGDINEYAELNPKVNS